MTNFNFNLKARIQGKDGECGTLAGLVVDSEARVVTALIIQRGHLLAQRRVVPISTVQSAQEDDVYLSLGSYELDQYPEYRLVEFEEPIVELNQKQPAEIVAPFGLHGVTEPTVPTRKLKVREGIGAGYKVIEPGMVLKNLDGKVGKAARVAVDGEHHSITYLVARRGLVFPEYLVIPVTMIDEVSEDSITLFGIDEALSNLPQYKDVIGIDFLNE